MKITCKNHKTYRGIRKPTATCSVCKIIFHFRRLAKACGLPVAEARRAPKKVEEFCKEFGVAVLPTKTVEIAADLRLADQQDALAKTENFSAGLEADPEFPGVAFGAGPSIRFDAAPKGVDAEDALALQVAAVKLGAEKRIETFEPTWRTPEIAAQLQAHARGELTEHQSTALFLKLHDAGAFTGAVAVRREQVRNIGEGAKAE